MAVRRILSVTALLGLVACSGAADTDLFGPAPAGTSLPTEPGGRGDEPRGSGSGAGGAETTAPAAPAAPQAPAPAPPATTTPPQPPANPPAACSQEAEPNDALQRATAFSGSICGVVDKSLDVDFVEVVAPPNAKKLKLAATDGRLSYRIYEDGAPRVQNASPSTTLSVDPGSTYAVRVTATQITLDKIPYEIKVTFED